MREWGACACSRAAAQGASGMRSTRGMPGTCGWEGTAQEVEHARRGARALLCRRVPRGAMRGAAAARRVQAKSNAPWKRDPVGRRPPIGGRSKRGIESLCPTRDSGHPACLRWPAGMPRSWPVMLPASPLPAEPLCGRAPCGDEHVRSVVVARHPKAKICGRNRGGRIAGPCPEHHGNIHRNNSADHRANQDRTPVQTGRPAPQGRRAGQRRAGKKRNKHGTGRNIGCHDYGIVIFAELEGTRHDKDRCQPGCAARHHCGQGRASDGDRKEPSCASAPVPSVPCFAAQPTLTPFLHTGRASGASIALPS